MADRRGSRFVAEALFLVALAVALALARLHALEIAGVMLLGWLVVAAIEWAAWRAEPHFGSGLPPRYYVPAVKLPPAQPLEQVDQGYPDASREEAPTWIASAELRAEVLGEWPHAAVMDVETEPEDEPELGEKVDDDDEAPPVPLPALAPEEEATEQEAEAAPGAPAVEPSPVQAVATLPEAQPGRRARHTLDPLAEVEPRRRFGRRTAAELETVEVPARPRAPRPLPGSSSRT